MSTTVNYFEDPELADDDNVCLQCGMLAGSMWCCPPDGPLSPQEATPEPAPTPAPTSVAAATPSTPHIKRSRFYKIFMARRLFTSENYTFYYY